MKTLPAFLLPGLLLAACVAPVPKAAPHAPGGPYYFQAFETQPSAPMKLQGEMSDPQARAHAAGGKALYTVWFNEHGQPQKVEKRLRGAKVRDISYVYDGAELVEVRAVDEQGKELVRRFDGRRAAPVTAAPARTR